MDQSTLHFPPPLDRSIENILTITSEADKPITFKMKTSAPNFYAVKKRTGFLSPGGTEKISITFRLPQGGASGCTPDERKKDKFQLELRYLASDQSEDAAYNAIGSSTRPGNGDLATAINELNRSQRVPSADVPSGAKEQDILAAMWKSQTFKAGGDGLKQINCAFRTALPQGMQVKAKATAPPSQQQQGGDRSTQMHTAQAAGGGEVEELRRKVAKLEAEKRDLSAKVGQQGGGHPLWVTILAAVIAMVLGMVLSGST